MFLPAKSSPHSDPAIRRKELMPEQRAAYIEYEEPRDAEDAAREMDGKMLEKSKIRSLTQIKMGLLMIHG